MIVSCVGLCGAGRVGCGELWCCVVDLFGVWCDVLWCHVVVRWVCWNGVCCDDVYDFFNIMS